MSIGISVYASAMFVCYTYLASFVIESGMSYADAAGYVSLIGVANMAGRILLGRAADSLQGSRRGKVWLFGGSMIVCGVAMLGLAAPFGGGQTFLSMFSLIFGLSAGTIVSLAPPILVDSLGLDALPLALGGVYSMQAPLVLLAPPLAGVLRSAQGDYTAVWLAAGITMCAAAGVLWGVPARVGDAGGVAATRREVSKAVTTA
jgi:cyanate permease